MMTANKLCLALIFFVFLIGCNSENHRNELEALNILNLTVQTIYSEINVTSCFRKTVNEHCQCEEAFSYKGDSIIIVNQIFDHTPPEIYSLNKCIPINIDTSLWNNITYFKKINLSSIDDIHLERKDYKTLFFLIHQPWKCDDKISVHVSMNGPKAFSGYLVTFKPNAQNGYILDRVELMGFN